MASKLVFTGGGALEGNKRLIREALKRAADSFIQELKSEIPAGRGRRGPFGRAGGQHLRDSLKARVKGDSIEIVSTVPHFLPFIEGSKNQTEDYPIRPRRGKKALSFPYPKFFRKTKKGKKIRNQRSKKAKALGIGEAGIDNMVVKRVSHPPIRPFRPFKRIVAKLPRHVQREMKKVF